ncbi:DUF2218 domain-containing protein [Corynebacterium aquilae]|uniref:DUF2218 domain-containing protein n=1 Tax=Corynebacterium aquilae DSM 44791 TaxID=1431546 RepID=A0A1L7CF27_9CORY|nr:DUF2218 domain-containing protein [Corynebacterium aquilae]APT84461.1 hypothetical protein CAQU_04615 [Corynebacterium aquilae DSM 44791]
MLYSHALVLTQRPARYGKQMAAHFAHKLETSWDGEMGTLLFVGRGKDCDDPRFAYEGTAVVTMTCVEQGLDIVIDAPEELLSRFEGVVVRHLVRFGASEDLAVTFEQKQRAE